MIACENSGHIIAYDFPEVRKIVSAGATNKPVKDYELTKVEKEQLTRLRAKAKAGKLMLDE